MPTTADRLTPAPRGRVLALLLVLLALTGLLSAGLAALAPAPARAACACSRVDNAADLERLARSANAVFSGTVTGVTSEQREGGRRGARHRHDVEVRLVYKGRIREEVVSVLTTSGEQCDLGRLAEDERYVFLATADPEGYRASRCSGTQEQRPALIEELEALYGAGEPPQVEPPAETATFERVSGVEPPAPFERTAAPGAALVLLGLLGLFVVRRLSRGGS